MQGHFVNKQHTYVVLIKHNTPFRVLAANGNLMIFT